MLMTNVHDLYAVNDLQLLQLCAHLQHLHGCYDVDERLYLQYFGHYIAFQSIIKLTMRL